MVKKISIPDDAPGLIEAIVDRLTHHGAEVRDVLRRVSAGELEMIETITEADKDLTR